VTLMLVDAASMYFRAFYALPESITSPDGRPVNAIRGFLDMAAFLIEKRRPSRWVACLDLDWRPQFRVDLVPSYKAHRVAPGGGEQIPDALSPQVPQLLEVLTAFGLACAGAKGFEADDVIATLAHREGDAGTDPVEIVTGDRDLLALATERVTVLYTGRGIAKLEEMGPAQVQAKYGVPAANYADFAILRGDPSDGLPGVPGVGEKTATAVVTRFGSVEDIVRAADAGQDGFPAGAAAKIRAAREYLAVAPGAVRGRVDAPVEWVLDAGADMIPSAARDGERLAELAAELGIESSVARMAAAIAAAVTG
jgi:5'-3' exonuclease